jgi:hypothetical protein
MLDSLKQHQPFKKKKLADDDANMKQKEILSVQNKSPKLRDIRSASSIKRNQSDKVAGRRLLNFLNRKKQTKRIYL